MMIALIIVSVKKLNTSAPKLMLVCLTVTMEAFTEIPPNSR